MESLEDEHPGHKVLVVGPPMAGKTTFITKYVHGDYYANEAYKRTIGVDFALKHLQWEDGRKITLQFWDIAGQERTETMSRMYYQDAHACVIMFDMTYEKSLEICLKWKTELDSKCTLEDGEPIPCILLANKSDLTARRKFTSEEIEAFAQRHGFIHTMETSVKYDRNVTEAMQYLVRHLLEKENLPPPEPRSTGETIVVQKPSPSAASSSNNCCS